MTTSELKGLPLGKTKRVEICDGPCERDLDLAMFDPYPCRIVRYVTFVFEEKLCVVERVIELMRANITGVKRKDYPRRIWKIEGEAGVPAGEDTMTRIYFRGEYSTQTRKGIFTIKHGQEFSSGKDNW